MGLDLNGDGVLQDQEVVQTQFLCNGAAGTAGAVSLVRLTAEPAGMHCGAVGGTRVDSGIDINGNGALEAAEVMATSYVCEGASGQKSLIRLDPEQPGANCPNGGTVIRAGVDTNNDGVLQDSEVTATGYVCGTSSADFGSSPDLSSPSDLGAAPDQASQSDFAMPDLSTMPDLSLKPPDLSQLPPDLSTLL